MPAYKRFGRHLCGIRYAGALAAVAVALYAEAGAQAVEPPGLLFPVRCEIGRDCWFFAYMDLQSGAAYRDYRCGFRTYEGHKGTDIAPVDPAARLPVIAAADGVVAGVRDGMDDKPARGPDRAGRECGNGVRLNHGGGWTTQYCHLQRGGVMVRKGARVSAGEVLGRTGSSGRSEIPHLHFQVERSGRPVDPFSGAEAANLPRCEVSPSAPGTALWRPGTYPARYTPTIIQRAGLTTEVPDKEQALHGGYPRLAPTSAPAIVGYIVLLGALSGTAIETIITGPDGRILFRNRRVIDRNRARHFVYAGKRRKVGAWKAGVYRAEFVVSGEALTGSFRMTRGAEIKLQ